MDIQAVSEMDVAIEVGSLSQAEHQGRMPLGVIVYVIWPERPKDFGSGRLAGGF
jgi:hypothetical protein